MYRIATITFHHAHNFGSALQAYALQEYVKALAVEKGKEIDYQIIDYYPEVQEELYNVFKPARGVRNLIKNLIALPYSRKLQVKHEKFEKFLVNHCKMTTRYKSNEELVNKYPDADCYISGSDQLWNVRTIDFSPAYYFDFLPDFCKRISYAASLGPLQIDWSKYDAEECKRLLKKYSAVSVREGGSAENIKEILEIDCEINIDPTLLLKGDEWRKVQSDANYNNGQYILLYCLEPSKEQLAMADAISKKFNLPIVVLRYNNKNDMFNHFVKKYDSGPEDFLAYIDNAALVLSSSFHGTAFSLIYHKPFYVFNGMYDNRISDILVKIGMTERSLDNLKDIARVSLDAPNGNDIETFLDEERQVSKIYLERSLGIE